MTPLWTALGGKVVDRFADLLLSPALGFWFGGLLAWVWAHDWQDLTDLWTSRVGDAGAVAQVSIAVAALLGVAASAALVERLTLTSLRVLEGYWPRWTGPVSGWAIRRRGRRIEGWAKKWRELYLSQADHDQAQAAEYRRLNVMRSKVPALPLDRMPTALGDLLRVMETRPRLRYGLDAVVCFPRLWLVLPDQAREDVAAARGQLDAAGRLWIWSLLFIVWTPLAWWALPVAVAGMWVAYRLALLVATGLTDLVQACFDLYRGDLYDQLGLVKPGLADEAAAGAALTAFLERGTPPP